MSRFPRLSPTTVIDETYAGVTYHLEGQVVPALTIDVSNRGVYFEHHILFWKDPQIVIEVMPMKGILKRMIAGMQIFLTRARGSGMVSFSRDGAGRIVPIHLVPGRAIHVREHQFLAATDNVAYGFVRQKGFMNRLLGDTGYFVDRFVCPESEGIVWLHAYGDAFEIALRSGESIDVEPGSWLWRDETVSMSVKADTLTSGFLGGSEKFVLNRFTGPGKVGIQSMFVHAKSDV